MGIEITGRLQWQAWQDRVLPPVEKVADGLWSLPVPIPDNPLRYVLVYALEIRDGLVLIDAGWDDDESWRALCAGIAATGHAVADVRAVLVTHFHGDHLGLAGRVREASGAYVALHRLDAEPFGPVRAPEELGDMLTRHLSLHGAPEEEVLSVAGALRFDRILAGPKPDVLLEDGQDIRLPGLALRVVWTPGHSPGHSCFYLPHRRMLFSGDHVLPRITPQIAAYAQDTGNPLADFLRSLDRLVDYPVDEVLPAHEYRFRGLGDRLAAMVAHHVARLAELHQAVLREPGLTAYELSSRIGWSRPWAGFDALSRRFALGETVAHLTLLAGRGTVRGAAGHPSRWYPVSSRP